VAEDFAESLVDLGGQALAAKSLPNFALIMLKVVSTLERLW